MRALSIFKGRTMRCIFWVVVIGLAANVIRIHQPDLKAALLPRTVVPYTVVLQDFTVQRDGTAVPSFRLTVAVRSDGSRAMETTGSNPAKPFSERILNFASGKKTYILQHLQVKSTTFDPARGNPSHWLHDPSANCLFSGSSRKEQFVDEEVVGGYRAVKITQGPTTEWLALDYGCALVKDQADWPDGQASEKKLVALIPGEPATSMFEEPAGFQEVPPSRFLPAEHVKQADTYYQSHRPLEDTPHQQ